MLPEALGWQGVHCWVLAQEQELVAEVIISHPLNELDIAWGRLLDRNSSAVSVVSTSLHQHQNIAVT